MAMLESMTAEVYEFLVSLACGAAVSYRKASTLNPFPKSFLTETKDKNYDKLVACLLNMPSSEKLFEASSSSSSPEGSRGIGMVASTASPKVHLSSDQQSFLSFLEQDCARLRTVKFEQIRAHLGSVPSTLRPDYIYEIIHDESKPSTQEFLRLKAEFGSRLAFHGSAAENWYSIVNTGLRNFSGTEKQRTGALFGEGIYLSTSLQVAVDFSRAGECWAHGIHIGPRLRVVGLCEVIAHPDYCKSSSSSSSSTAASSSSSSSSQDSPDTYLVVPNSGHVRVRYLLVYTERVASCSQGAVGAGCYYWGSLFWILLYVAILLSIVLSQEESKTFLRYCVKTASKRGKNIVGFLF